MGKKITERRYNPVEAAYERSRPINALRLLVEEAEIMTHKGFVRPYENEKEPPSKEEVLALAKRLDQAAKKFLGTLT